MVEVRFAQFLVQRLEAKAAELPRSEVTDEIMIHLSKLSELVNDVEVSKPANDSQPVRRKGAGA